MERVFFPRRVGLLGITRKVCENIEFQSQLIGCIKHLVIGFPDTPLMVTEREKGGPGLKRRTECVAPVSKRKLVVWPYTVRVTWGACGIMVTGANVGSLGPFSPDPGFGTLTPAAYASEGSPTSSDPPYTEGRA